MIPQTKNICGPGGLVEVQRNNLPKNHKTAEWARRDGRPGAEVPYLPRYSPDLNPIERLFSRIAQGVAAFGQGRTSRAIERWGTRCG